MELSSAVKMENPHVGCNDVLHLKMPLKLFRGASWDRCGAFVCVGGAYVYNLRVYPHDNASIFLKVAMRHIKVSEVSTVCHFRLYFVFRIESCSYFSLACV